MELTSVLKALSVLNRDNGRTFTVTDRLDAINSLLTDSPYTRVNEDGLFHMYSRKQISMIHDPVILVSSHVDCERGITRCFTEGLDDKTLLGTFDNAITNSAIVHLMIAGLLPDNVLIAFTGDEEEDGKGAKDVAGFLKRTRLKVRNIFVLDVTSEGWDTESDFTVENDFWNDDFGKMVIDVILKTGRSWRFVPGDPLNIPNYIPRHNVIQIEAYSDESWEYDEADIPCFSFCLPSKGDMHDNAGILVREASFRNYTDTLGKLLTELA